MSPASEMKLKKPWENSPIGWLWPTPRRSGSPHGNDGGSGPGVGPPAAPVGHFQAADAGDFCRWVLAQGLLRVDNDINRHGNFSPTYLHLRLFLF
jgi:hypothetical protein